MRGLTFRAAAADGPGATREAFETMAMRVRATLDTKAQAAGARGAGFALIAILSIGQIIGWGTTFYLPAVLGDEMGRELGVSRETVFLGVTLMVAIGALLSPTCGRLMDRHGAGRRCPLRHLPDR